MQTRFDDFDTQTQTDELANDCPYCDKPLDGSSVDGMHQDCYEQFGNDLDEAFQSEWLSEDMTVAERMIDDLMQQAEEIF